MVYPIDYYLHGIPVGSTEMGVRPDLTDHRLLKGGGVVHFLALPLQPGLFGNHGSVVSRPLPNGLC